MRNDVMPSEANKLASMRSRASSQYPARKATVMGPMFGVTYEKEITIT